MDKKCLRHDQTKRLRAQRGSEAKNAFYDILPFDIVLVNLQINSLILWRYCGRLLAALTKGFILIFTSYDPCRLSEIRKWDVRNLMRKIKFSKRCCLEIKDLLVSSAFHHEASSHKVVNQPQIDSPDIFPVDFGIGSG